MSKKKTKKTKLFSDILASNKKDIMVMKGDKEMSIAEASIESAEESILVPVDGVIPISGDELAKKKKTQSFTVGARYSKPIFTLYENGIKSANLFSFSGVFKITVKLNNGDKERNVLKSSISLSFVTIAMSSLLDSRAN